MCLLNTNMPTTITKIIQAWYNKVVEQNQFICQVGKNKKEFKSKVIIILRIIEKKTPVYDTSP